MGQIGALEGVYSKNKGFSCFYGESASGKTTMVKIGCIKKLESQKVLYLDTENGFSIERFKQIAGKNYEELLKKLLIFKIKSFKDQQLKINNLDRLISEEDISLVIIDTISYYYRTLKASKPTLARSMMISQLRTLKEISKKIPVLITSQVYSDLNDNKIKSIAAGLISNFCDVIIKLEKNPRKIIFNSPNINVNFKIVNEGVVTV